MSNIYISILDFALLPFFLGIIYAIAYRIRNRRYPPRHPLRKYYIPALTVKVVGAIFIGMVYAYYYKQGDTFYYFAHAQVINKALDDSIVKWINLVLHIPDYYDPNYSEYTFQMLWYNEPSSYMVVSITTFLSFFTFTTYFPTTVLFAFISFTGIWALFRTFATLYPHLIRQIAIAILFIPSVFVWGSGIFKDTICIFGLGWLTYGTFRMLIQKDFSFRNILLSVLSFLLIAKVKLYIILAFSPALLLWIFFNYSQRIKNPSAKILSKALFIGVLIVGFFFFMQRFSKELGKYSLENVAKTSYITRGYIYYVSADEGSSYNLGDFDPTIPGMASKFLPAVNVTFFRPYIWESKKVIVFLSAAEALIFLLVSLKIIFGLGIRKVIKAISVDPTIQFCLTFAIIFAFAVGVSSYNFGALSRYKIPCLPFFALALVLIYYKFNPPSKNILSFSLK
jgi:hypothetical protein